MEALTPQKKRWVRDRARDMRKEQTLAERLLWQELRPWSEVGLRFRRQYPIGPYVADIACPAARLVVELDGSSHEQTLNQDEQRTRDLEGDGWMVVRFGNFESIEGAAAVARHVVHVCATRLREFGVTIPPEAARFMGDYL